MKRLWLGSGLIARRGCCLGTEITYRRSAKQELIEKAMQGIVYSNDVGRQLKPNGAWRIRLAAHDIDTRLQSLGYANRDGWMRQVFGHVSDSAGAARGFGVTGCAI